MSSGNHSKAQAHRRADRWGKCCGEQLDVGCWGQNHNHEHFEDGYGLFSSSECGKHEGIAGNTAEQSQGSSDHAKDLIDAFAECPHGPADKDKRRQ